MIGRAKKFDEVKVTLGDEDTYYAYIDYDTDGHRVTMHGLTAAEKWRVIIVLLRICGDMLPGIFKVKMLGTEAWVASMLQKEEGDPPIKEEPPF